MNTVALPGMLLCAALALAPAASAGELRDISTSDTPDGIAYTLTITEAQAAPAHFLLTGPPRLVLDLPASVIGGKLANTSELPVDTNPIIAGVRLGRHAGPDARVVFDLHASPDSQSLTVSTLQRGDTQLVTVQIAGAGTQRSASHNATDISDSGSASGPDQWSQGATNAALTAAAPSISPSRATSTGPQNGSGVSTSGPANPESAQAAPSGGSFVFGAQADSTVDSARQDASPSPPDTNSDWFVDRLLLESGRVSDAPEDGTNTHLQFVAGMHGRLSDTLSARFSARIDGQYQAGDLTELEYLRVDYDESWIRFAPENWRITAGAQRIIWGRADEFSPTDKLSTRDFTRLIMDDLQDRRRANPALRVERMWGNRHLDLVYLPTFREAELPADESAWFPVNPATGAVVGLPLTPAARGLLRGAIVRNDFDGSEGFGVKFSDTGTTLDYAVTVQRVNNPEPYFTLARPPGDSSPAILNVVYPRTWVVGGDAAIAAGAWTFRGEAAWLSDSPYTDATTGQLNTSDELHWVLGAEVFPGDGDLRLTTQLSGRHLLDAENNVDFEDVFSVLGEFESPFDAFGLPARAQLRYGVRLDERGSYLNPEVAYTGLEPSEIYIGAHLYSGTYGTQEGFYAERDSVVIGWRASF